MADSTSQQLVAPGLLRLPDPALAAAIRRAILDTDAELPTDATRLIWRRIFNFDNSSRPPMNDARVATAIRQLFRDVPAITNGTHAAVTDPVIRALFRGYAAWADEPHAQLQEQQQPSGYQGLLGQDFDPDTSSPSRRVPLPRQARPQVPAGGSNNQRLTSPNPTQSQQQQQGPTPDPPRTRNDGIAQGPTPETAERTSRPERQHAPRPTNVTTPVGPAASNNQGPTPPSDRAPRPEQTGRQVQGSTQQPTPPNTSSIAPSDIDPTTFMSPVGQPQRPAQPEGSVGGPGRPSPDDYGQSGDPIPSWRGQQQPPVAIRARQLLNWVRDEDVDRRRDFTREAREAADWIEEQLRSQIGEETRLILLEARRALDVHGIFEGYHYRRTMRTGTFVAESVPKYAPRLPYRSDMPLELGNAGPLNKAKRVLPEDEQITPRPWGLVNDMWTSDAERSIIRGMRRRRNGYMRTIAWDESRLWQNEIDEDNGGLTANTAWRENKAYEDCIDIDQVGLEGWTWWGTDAEGNPIRRIFNGDILGNEEIDFAVERGARRAGLQAALRQMRNVENQRATAAMGDAGGMLLLPGGIAGDFVVHDEQAIRRQAGLGDDAPPLAVESLPGWQLQSTQGKRDPQGFIANMAQFWRNMRPHMEEAREAVVQGGAGRGPRAELDQGLIRADWVQPPESVFGPYVWRGVDFDTQVQQDLLRQMRGLKRLFDRERSIADRTLLRDMDMWFNRGLANDRTNLPEMHAARDTRLRDDGRRGWRFVDEMELEWIRFLLNPGSKPEMLNDLLPRTKLFIQFAERLNRLFMDPGCDLFPNATTFVGIEDLIQAMAKLDGPVSKITFYPYDVKMFLERLAHQGRCQYFDDWRLYGRVARPVFEHFPEHLIVWRELADNEMDFINHPEDMVFAPRMDERRTWADIVNQPAQLDPNVANYFRSLAYRWGYSMRTFQNREDKNWLMQTEDGDINHQLGVIRMHRTLDDFEYFFRLASNWDANSPNHIQGANTVPAGEEDILDSVNGPLVDVINATLDAPPAAGQNVTTRDALQTIRAGIIDECVRNDNLLFAGRSTDYRDRHAPRTRGSLWSWARPAVRGEVKRFFGLDRWPLNLQSQATQERIKSGVDDDPQFRWNVYLEDPTPWSYYRPKARPYADERIKVRTGQRQFQIGDTARQKEVVKNNIMAMVGRPMGLGDDGQPLQETVPTGFFSRFRFGNKRKRAVVENVEENDAESDDGTDPLPRPAKLPRLEHGSVPVSRDLLAEAAQARKTQEDATRARTVLATEAAAMEGVTDVTAQRQAPARPGLRIESNFPLLETRPPPAAAAA